MDEQRIRRPRTVRRGVIVITATLAGALGAAALTAAPATPVEAAPAAEPVWRRVVERRALERVVELMPAGGPATQVMRAALERERGSLR